MDIVAAVIKFEDNYFKCANALLDSTQRTKHVTYNSSEGNSHEITVIGIKANVIVKIVLAIVHSDNNG